MQNSERAGTSSASRLINPRKWNLYTRFMVTAGSFIVLFAAVTFYLAYTNLKATTENSIHSRVADFSRLVSQQEKELSHNLVSSVVRLGINKEITSMLEIENNLGLQLSMAEINNAIHLNTDREPIPIQYYLPDLEPFFHSLGFNTLGDPQRKEFGMVKQCKESNSSLMGLQVLSSKPTLTAISPAIKDGMVVGFIEASTSYDEIFARLNLSPEYGMAIILHPKQQESDKKQSPPRPAIRRIAMKLGVVKSAPILRKPFSGEEIQSSGNLYYKIRELNDYLGNPTGQLILFYKGDKELGSFSSAIKLLGGITFLGVVLILVTCSLNIRRILDSIRKIRKAITFSISSDYQKPFIADSLHCRSLLSCTKESCPVHSDSTKVCYLEVGSKAINPELRNSCIYIEEYGKCDYCPVYQARPGDQLTEMRHVINGVIGIWGTFLNQVGKLFTDVTRNANDSVPHLDDVAKYLQQMAGLSRFTHDMQGVYSKDEVYSQLEWVFTEEFKLRDFNLLEINASENRMELAIDRYNITDSHLDVFINCELCRAKRVAEDVSSYSNPHLCPYFNIDHQKEVRCCLPMVMGGRVGAVFTFIVSREQWLEKKRDLSMMRKYLDETAPTLASLRLLQISKEQALRDPLTKCHNRRFMDEYLVQLEGLNSRSPRNVGFIMADLDHFKMVNDEFGHLAGDDVLKQVAEILRKNIRKSDLLIRYGGEEFLIVLMETTKECSTMDIAEKLRMAIQDAKMALPSGGNLQKTISMGVAEYPSDAEHLYKVIKYADVALYKAKEQGRNKVVRFLPEMWDNEEY